MNTFVRLVSHSQIQSFVCSNSNTNSMFYNPPARIQPKTIQLCFIFSQIRIEFNGDNRTGFFWFCLLSSSSPNHASDILFNREEIKSRSVHNPNSNKLHTRENQQSSSAQYPPLRMSSPKSRIQLRRGINDGSKTASFVLYPPHTHPRILFASLLAELSYITWRRGEERRCAGC